MMKYQIYRITTLSLQDNVKIEPVGTSPLRRIVFEHPDRAFASGFLRALHTIADSRIRQEIRDRTQSREAYLEQALATTAHPDHRRALTSLLMEQEHVRMILAMDEPFAAIIAEPPSAGVRPHWPRRGKSGSTARPPTETSARLERAMASKERR